MSNSRQKALMLGCAVILLFCLCSCAAIPAVGLLAGGSVNTFQGDYQIRLDLVRPDLKDIIGQVGKDMGFEISAYNNWNNSISLSAASGGFRRFFTGNINRVSITAQIMEEQKLIRVGIMALGNYDVGTKDEVDKLFADFSERILKKLQPA